MRTINGSPAIAVLREQIAEEKFKLASAMSEANAALHRAAVAEDEIERLKGIIACFRCELSAHRALLREPAAAGAALFALGLALGSVPFLMLG